MVVMEDVTMTTTSLVTSAESFTSKTMPHRICMVSLWCIPEYNPRDCKMNLSAQLCVKIFDKKCIIQAAMNRNIKLCRPLLFLDVLLDHLGNLFHRLPLLDLLHDQLGTSYLMCSMTTL